MEFNVKSGHPEKQRTACIVVGICEPRRLTPIAAHIDKLSEGFISNIVRKGDIEGKLGQTLLLHHVPGLLADRILLIGCGKEKDFDEKQYIDVVKKSVKALNQTGAMEAVSYLSELNIKGKDIYWKIKTAIQVISETGYQFDKYKSSKSKFRRPLSRLTFCVQTRKELTYAEKAIHIGQALSKGIELTKNLGNTPPNYCTPKYLTEVAKSLAKEFSSLSAAILNEKEIKNLKMGAFLAVAQGADSSPYLISLSYKGTKKDSKPIVLVGKGITFDTGGNSLKPAANMIGMKYDMCGAATVFGVIRAIAQMELPINVIGVVPTCENMISGKATRPDDVVTSMSGKTVEILNTDAEGRLILADALTYVERFNPDCVIDIATLTGACVVALGKHATAVYSNHDALANELLQAGQMANDKGWHMPLWDEYHEQLKSNVADIANIGGPEAGSVTAACFLATFTKSFNWAHLDVAGTATVYTGPSRGATGRPVALLTEFLIERSNKK